MNWWPFNRERREAVEEPFRYKLPWQFNVANSIPGSDLNRQHSGVAYAGAVLYSQALQLAEFPMRGELVGLTPSVLGDIAMRVLLDGEVVLYIDKEFRLVRAPHATIEGGSYDPSTWVYRVHLPGPERTTDRVVAAESVLHIIWRPNEDQPWRGDSPFDTEAGRACASYERSLFDDAQAVTAQYLPTPQTTSVSHPGKATKYAAKDSATALQKEYGPTTEALRLARGGLHVGPSFRGTGKAGGVLGAYDSPTYAGRDETGADSPLRWGVQPDRFQLQAYLDLARATLAGVSIPPELVLPSDGTTRRESFRQFFTAGVLPFARIIEEEVARKLVPVRLTFGQLSAVDLQVRSRALAQVVTAGYSKEQAAEMVGLELRPDRATG